MFIESRECSSLLWNFLALLQIAKANILQHKLERTKEALDEALPIVDTLKHPKLIEFVEKVLIYNDHETIKKQSLISSIRSSMRSSRMSVTSLHAKSKTSLSQEDEEVN